MRTEYLKGEMLAHGRLLLLDGSVVADCDSNQFDPGAVAREVATAEQIMIRWNAFEPLMRIAEQLSKFYGMDSQERGEALSQLVELAQEALEKGCGLA